MGATAPAADQSAWFQAQILAAGSARTPLYIRGGGSKSFLVPARADESVLDTRGHCGVLDYDARELVIEARSGTPLAEIESLLEAQGQMLGCEPPHFGGGATLGGVVATGLSGPRRPFGGSVRDQVLGVTLIDGRGQRLKFGGRVIKNVAGFDVSRLMTGAYGSLGLITEVALRVTPRPEREETRCLACDAPGAQRLLLDYRGRGLPLSATAWVEGRLWLRLSGSAEAVNRAARSVGGEATLDGDACWRQLRDQQLPWFARGGNLWRLSLAANAPLDPAADCLLEWFAGLRWLRTAEGVAPEAAGGQAVLFRSADVLRSRFPALPARLLDIHRRLKAHFDPLGLINTGRLFPER